MTKDISASIRARLKNIAKEEKTDFNAVQDASRQAMWCSFLKKNELEFISLPEVVTLIGDFVIPIMSELSTKQV